MPNSFIPAAAAAAAAVPAAAAAPAPAAGPGWRVAPVAHRCVSPPLTPRAQCLTNFVFLQVDRLRRSLEWTSRLRESALRQVRACICGFSFGGTRGAPLVSVHISIALFPVFCAINFNVTQITNNNFIAQSTFIEN